MSSRSTLRGRRTIKQIWENVREENETSENVNSLNDVDMEYRDVVDGKIEVDHVKDWDKKQELISCRGRKERFKRGAAQQKTDDMTSVILNGEHSFSDKTLNNLKRGAIPKTKQDLPNGKSDFISDTCSMEEEDISHDCPAQKRKRCLFECDMHNSKFQEKGLICIGILPGLKSIISSSDDSDQSCSSESENNENSKYDLLGRELVYLPKKSTESK